MLNKAELSGFGVSEAAENLWEEWLGRYFDGNAHLVGGVERPFPAMTRGYGESAPPQPLAAAQDKVGLHCQVTVVSPGEVECYPDGPVSAALSPEDAAAEFGEDNPETNPHASIEVEAACESVVWEFAILASGPETGSGNARYQARRSADLLFGLLSNASERLDLAAKGLTELRPRLGRPAAGKGWVVMKVWCGARMRWNI